MPNEELVSTVPALAHPIVIINDEVASRCLGLIKDATTLKIVSVEDFKKAGEYMNSLGKADTYIDNLTLGLAKPFRAEAERIRAEGKVYQDQIKPAKDALSKEMVAFDRLQKEELAKAEAERQRLLREAQRLKLEAEQAEAQRLQLLAEAKARQEAAAAAVEAAPDEAAFEAAAQVFDKGLQKLEEAQAIPEVVVPKEVLQAHKGVYVPPVYKAKGARGKETAIIEDVDLTKIPNTYLILNEAKVRRHILDRTITAATPGIKFRIEDSFGGSGR